MYRYWSSLTWALHSIWSITRYCFGVLRISLYFVELHWSSYLSGRFQQVVIDGATSDKFDIDFGLPQGSCIGLSLFSIYAGQLFDIVTQHLPTVHCYADDTKLYLAFRQGDRATQYSAVAAVEACIQDVREWVIRDKLKKKSETWVPGLMPTLQWVRTLQKLSKQVFFYLHNISRIGKFLA